MDKSDIRAYVKAQKRLLTDDVRHSAANSVFDKIEQLEVFLASSKILVYNSLPDELSTRLFLEKWSHAKKLYLPRVNGLNLEILPYEKTSLQVGAFRIEEPLGDELTNPEEMELVIVPAVAFDRKGNRVGRGKGFYDRLLSKINAYKIGVAYDFQLVDEIDFDAFDVPVDMVITESHSIVIRKRS